MEIPTDKNCMTSSENKKFTEKDNQTKITNTRLTVPTTTSPSLTEKPFSIYHSSFIKIQNSTILSPIEVKFEPYKYTTIPTFTLIADLPFTLKLTQTLKDLEFIIQTKNTASKIIIYNPSNSTITINANEPLLDISARTRAIFVAIHNEQVEMTDMYLPNMPIPIEDIASDPDIEKAAPETKSKLYDAIFSQTKDKLNNIDYAKINNAVFSTLLSEEQENINQSHLINYEMSIFQSINRNTFAELQNNDKYLSNFKKICKNNPNQMPNFTVRRDVLYKLFPNQNKIALAIPQVLMKSLVHHLHNKYCHTSHKRLYNIFKIKYFALNAAKRFREEQENCYTCTITQQARNDQQTVGRQRSSVATRPRQGISVDLITGLPTTRGKQSAYVLISDVFTSYTYMFLIPNKETIHVYNALLNCFSVLGQPEFVISDADNSLIPAITELSTLLGFQYSTTVPYSQHQNRVEASYRDLKATIRKVLHDPTTNLNRSDWDIGLIYALQSYNACTIGNTDVSRQTAFFKSQENLFSFEPEIFATDVEITKPLAEYTKKIKETYPKKPKNFNVRPGQVLYSKTRQLLQGQTSAYFLNCKGPFLVKEVYKKRLFVKAQNLVDKKMYTIHFKDLILPSNFKEYSILLNDSFDKDLLLTQSEIKRAQSTSKDDEPIQHRIDDDIQPTSTTTRTPPDTEEDEDAPLSETFKNLQSIDSIQPRRSPRLQEKGKIKSLLVKILSTKSKTPKNIIFKGTFKNWINFGKAVSDVQYFSNTKKWQKKVLFTYEITKDKYENEIEVALM